VRSGNFFTGYWAQDLGNGVHGDWNIMGFSEEVDMSSQALVGLALTAHNNGAVNTSHFDHVQVTQVNPSSLMAPGNLTVDHVAPYKSQAEVILAWQPESDNESGFAIERSTDDSNFTSIATVAAGTTSFIDTGGNKGLAPGTYYYRVKAFAAGLPDSAYSKIDSVRFALPGQPLTIAHGFENHADLSANGSAEIL